MLEGKMSQGRPPGGDDTQAEAVGEVAKGIRGLKTLEGN